MTKPDNSTVDQHAGESLHEENTVKGGLPTFEDSNNSHQHSKSKLLDDVGRSGSTESSRLRDEVDMGRHETFEDATPINEPVPAPAGSEAQGQEKSAPVRDWNAYADMHPGLVPYPPHAPKGLMAIDGVIQNEARRLLVLAEEELERVRQGHLGDPDSNEWPRVEQILRDEMRMDALAVVSASRSGRISALERLALSLGCRVTIEPRDPGEIENDVREIDEFATAVRVFAEHGRANGLGRGECQTLLFLATLMMDPITRLLDDYDRPKAA